jgi:hypothetical protein
MFEGDEDSRKRKKKSKSRKRLANSAKVASGAPNEKENGEGEENCV